MPQGRKANWRLLPRGATRVCSCCPSTNSSLLVRVPDLWSQGVALEFSSPGLIYFVCWLLFGVRPTPPRVTAVAHKRPQSFGQKGGWQVTPEHTYTLDPTKSEWADYAAVLAWCGNLSGNELTYNLSGNTQPQSSQLTDPLWTDRGINSEIRCAS